MASDTVSLKKTTIFNLNAIDHCITILNSNLLHENMKKASLLLWFELNLKFVHINRIAASDVMGK